MVDNVWKCGSIEEMKNLVHCKVKISMVNGKSEVGLVYTIDPLSQSLVLYQPKTGHMPEKLSIVFNHSVKDFVVLEEAQDEIIEVMNDLGRCENEQKYTEEELLIKKINTKSWLERNRLPVTESGNRLKIADALEIFPPYTPESCQSNNEIILSRVQTILRSQARS